MQIFGPYRVSTPQQPTGSAPSNPREVTNQKAVSQPVDQLDLSDPGVDRLAGAEAPTVEGIRFERVADIRRQIAEGAYETDEKLDLALDRLLDEIG